MVDGRPSLSLAYPFLGSGQTNSFFDLNSNLGSIIEVAAVDENGTITALNLVDAGSGFEPSTFLFPNPPNDAFGRLQIMVSGGGVEELKYMVMSYKMEALVMIFSFRAAVSAITI